MTQIEEILALLEEHRKTLPEKDRDDLYESSTAVSSLCQRFYKNESAFQKELEIIKSQLGVLMVSQSDDFPVFNLNSIKDLYRRLLNSLIFEIQNLGLPSKSDLKIDRSVNVNVNQSQSQIQNQSVELSFIIEIIKDELTGKQIRELKEIMDTESGVETKKESINQKLKDFGVNVSAGILSGILSNPSVWGLLV